MKTNQKKPTQPIMTNEQAVIAAQFLMSEKGRVIDQRADVAQLLQHPDITPPQVSPTAISKLNKDEPQRATIFEKVVYQQCHEMDLPKNQNQHHIHNDSVFKMENQPVQLAELSELTHERDSLRQQLEQPITAEESLSQTTEPEQASEEAIVQETTKKATQPIMTAEQVEIATQYLMSKESRAINQQVDVAQLLQHPEVTPPQVSTNPISKLSKDEPHRATTFEAVAYQQCNEMDLPKNQNQPHIHNDSAYKIESQPVQLTDLRELTHERDSLKQQLEQAITAKKSLHQATEPEQSSVQEATKQKETATKRAQTDIPRKREVHGWEAIGQSLGKIGNAIASKINNGDWSLKGRKLGLPSLIGGADPLLDQCKQLSGTIRQMGDKDLSPEKALSLNTDIQNQTSKLMRLCKHEIATLGDLPEAEQLNRVVEIKEGFSEVQKACEDVELPTDGRFDKLITPLNESLKQLQENIQKAMEQFMQSIEKIMHQPSGQSMEA